MFPGSCFAQDGSSYGLAAVTGGANRNCANPRGACLEDRSRRRGGGFAVVKISKAALCSEQMNYANLDCYFPQIARLKPGFLMIYSKAVRGERDTGDLGSYFLFIFYALQYALQVSVYRWPSKKKGFDNDIPCSRLHRPAVGLWYCIWFA